MKRGLIFGLIFIALVVTLIIIFYPSNDEENSEEKVCANVNETCGGGIQGPNGESDYTYCCEGLVCEGPELGICVEEQE